MLTKAKIRNFGSYQTDQLEQMKRDLAFHMPVPALAFCANYYRTHEKRDPFIEEMRMLDLLFTTASDTLAFAAPTELLTNCGIIAETYADMMKKRHELFPDAKTPCTLAEALSLGTLYLERAGKESTFPHTLFLTEDLQNARLSHLSSNFVAAPASRFGLRTLRREKRLSETGDLLVLLRSGESVQPVTYKKSLAKLLNSPTATESLKAIRTVGDRGLLYEIMTLTPAARIELSRLSLTGAAVSPTMLSDSFEGDYLVRISPKSHPEFAKAAWELGIRAMAFAAVTHGNRLTFAENDEPLFGIDTGFLRAFLPSAAMSVKIDGEETAPAAPIAHTPKTPAICAYLANESSESAQTVEQRQTLYAAASSQPEKGFFRSALETLLTTVLTLAANGCDYRELRAAVGISLPSIGKDAKAMGEAMATILGVYRLQAELGLPLSCAKICKDESIAHPQISAFCMAQHAKGNDRLTAEGNRIYCVSPRLQKNGLLDFAALRGLLEHLFKLHTNGAIKSARVISRERITDAVRKMSTPELTCLFDGYAVLADGYMDLAILIESAEELSFTKIGRVTKRLSPLPVPEEIELPETVSLLALQEARIVLLCNQHDLAAEVLAERCQELDAKTVLICNGDALYENRLARAILDAQTLIVCTDTPIPHTPQVDFALDTFRRAGGRLLLVGKGVRQKKLEGIVLSDGISQKVLNQICKI